MKIMKRATREEQKKTTQQRDNNIQVVVRMRERKIEIIVESRVFTEKKENELIEK